MNVNFDSPDLVALVQDLVNAPAHIVPAVRGVVNKGALNIKKDAARRFTEQRVGGYLPHYARAISYDVDVSSVSVSADVGPDSSKPQGGMGAAIEYGTARAAPMPHLGPALDAEVPKMADALADVAVRLLG